MKLTEIRTLLEQDKAALFATCDWSMVRPVAPLSDRYVALNKDDIDATTGNKDPKKLVKVSNPDFLTDTKPEPDGIWYTYDRSGKRSHGFVIEKETDPWAKCGSAMKPKVRGILCDHFAYDKFGMQGEFIGRSLVRSKDLGGLWGEFLTLHAAEILERGLDEESKEQAAAEGKVLNLRVRDLIQWPVGAVQHHLPNDLHRYADSDLSSAVNTSVGSGRVTNWGSRRPKAVYFDQRGQVIQLPSTLPSISVSARNAEDVAYLLEILELGAKAYDRKQARKKGSSDAGK